MPEIVAENLSQNTGGRYDVMNTSTALPEKMKALGEKLALDHRNMSIWYEVDIQTDATEFAAVDVAVLREGVRLQISNSRRGPVTRDDDSGQVAGRDPRRARQGEPARRASSFPATPPRGSRCTSSTAARTCSRRTRRRSSARWRCGRSQEHAPDAASLASALGLDPALAARIYPRVVEKLTREPVEDFRIDFEDGFGNRPDAEEDEHARLAAGEVAAGLKNGTLPPSIGIRIKPLSEELKRRSLRTFDLFLTTLLDADRRRAAAELRRHAAEDHRARAGDRARRGLRRVRVLARAAGRHAAVRADDRDDAVDLRGGRQRRAAAADRRRRRPDRRRALRDLRLHRGLQHHRGAPAHAPPGLRLREARHAGRARRHRHLAVGRRHQRHADRIARGRAPRLAAARRARAPLARHRLLPGMGSASGAAAVALRRGLRVLPRRARRGVRAPDATSSRRRRRRRWSATCSTTRRPGRGC